MQDMQPANLIRASLTRRYPRGERALDQLAASSKVFFSSVSARWSDFTLLYEAVFIAGLSR